MELGELTSSNLDTIVNRIWVLEKRFENYCRQHNKVFSTTITLGPKLITLKCYLTKQK